MVSRLREDAPERQGCAALEAAIQTCKCGAKLAGDVVRPLLKTTSLMPNTPHYIVNLKSVDVAGATLRLPFEGDRKGTVIDRGTTLTYLPEKVYKATMIAVFDKHHDTIFYDFQDHLYIKHSGRVDDLFPEITFHFQGDLKLTIYPHDYLLPNGDGWYCVVLWNGRSQHEDLRDMVILGDTVLSNKIVVYDLENQIVGWTDYDY